MAKWRRAANIDKGQNPIVDRLRRVPGISVEPGHDDILVGYEGMTFWFEIKSEDKISKRTGRVLPSAIKDSQKRLLCFWGGHYRLIWTVDQILNEVIHDIVDPLTVFDDETLRRWSFELLK